MSPVLMHFCTFTNLLPAGCFSPNKKGTKGCMPAVVKRTVGSFSGTKEAEGMIVCPFSLKNSKNFSLNSDEVINNRIFIYKNEDNILAVAVCYIGSGEGFGFYFRLKTVAP